MPLSSLETAVLASVRDLEDEGLPANLSGIAARVARAGPDAAAPRRLTSVLDFFNAGALLPPADPSAGIAAALERLAARGLLSASLCWAPAAPCERPARAFSDAVGLGPFVRAGRWLDDIAAPPAPPVRPRACAYAPTILGRRYLEKAALPLPYDARLG